MPEQTLMPLSHYLCVDGCVGGWVFVCGCVFVCVCGGGWVGVWVVVRVGIHAELSVNSSCDLIN